MGGSYCKTVDRRDYPEMDIGEEGYRDLWPSGWWEPYIAGRPLVYFPTSRCKRDTFGVRYFWWQQLCGTSVGAKRTKHFDRHAV